MTKLFEEQSRAQLGGVKTRRNMIWNTALAKGRTSPDDPAWVVGSNSNSKYLFIFEKDACTARLFMGGLIRLLGGRGGVVFCKVYLSVSVNCICLLYFFDSVNHISLFL